MRFAFLCSHYPAPCRRYRLFAGARPQPAELPSAKNRQPTPPEVKSFDASAMDTTVDPCVDFYQYSCGNWLKSNPIPADQVRWVRSISLVQQRNLYLLWKDLDSAAAHPKDALQKQYGDFYASCMDTATIDKLGVQPIQPAWKQIAALKDAAGIPVLMGKLENQGWSDGFFDFGVGLDEKDSSKQIVEIEQGGISLPDRDYYIVDNPHFAEIRAQYVEHMKKMFALAGDSPEQAAKRSRSGHGNRNRNGQSLPEPHRTARSAKGLSHLLHGRPREDDAELQLARLCGQHRHQSLRHAECRNPRLLHSAELHAHHRVSRLMEELSSLAGSARGGIASRASPSSTKISTFFSRTLAGQKEPMPRWRQCTTSTDRALGEAVGQDWVKELFHANQSVFRPKQRAPIPKATQKPALPPGWI